MREKLIIRCSTEDVFEPYIKTYKKFKRKWLRNDWELTKVIAGYLDDPDFKEFFDYLRTKIDFAVSYIERKYTTKELLDAKLLKMWISATFEPTGEELGTKYEYPCSICQAGRVVRDHLILNLAKVPKGKDIVKTIAQDEWIVSEKLTELIQKEKITGVELRPVKHYSKKQPRLNWYQMVVVSTVSVSEQTKYGDPFRPNLNIEQTRTSCGHAINGVVYSELYLKEGSWNSSDIVKTDLYFGGHLNLIYPYPHILISQRFFRLLRKHKIKGYEVEVARFVSN